MTVTIYHNPRCSKSRQTLALIEEKGISPTIVEYLQTPPSQKVLKEVVGLLGVSPKDIVRKKEAKEAGLDIGAMTDAAVIKAMTETPAIIERPIIVAGNKAVMGRPPENVLDIL
ncbi:MAG: arsenate reductase (glutaredoxin) [Rhodospirillaceae bacterium]